MTTTLPTTMTAWSQDRYGAPEVVHPVEIDVPRPGPGEVLVRVAATSMNSADVRIMRGEPLLLRLGFGLRRPRTSVPGRDVVGTIVTVGPDVSGLAVDDRVVGELSGGGLGAFVVAPATQLVRVPDAVDDETAVTLPLAGGTAWQALDLAGVASGSRILVLGAGGGVGTFAVRLAVLRGAHVHALCSPRARAAVAALGAHGVGERDTDLAQLPAGTYDAVIDLGGVAPLPALQRLLRDGGCIVSVAGGEHRVFGPFGRMLRGALRSIGSTRRIRPLVATTRPELTSRVLEFAASGDLVPVIDTVYPAADARAALTHVESGRPVGKVLVTHP